MHLFDSSGNEEWGSLDAGRKGRTVDAILVGHSNGLPYHGHHRFSTLEADAGQLGPFTPLYDASTGLSEPTSACKTDVNGFLAKCVFTGSSSSEAKSTNSASGGGLSKSCVTNLNTWLTKCVFAAESKAGK